MVLPFAPRASPGPHQVRTCGRLCGSVQQNRQQRHQNLPRNKNCCVYHEEILNFLLVGKTRLWPMLVQWRRGGGGSAGLSGASGGSAGDHCRLTHFLGMRSLCRTSGQLCRSRCGRNTSHHYPCCPWLGPVWVNGDEQTWRGRAASCRKVKSCGGYPGKGSATAGLLRQRQQWRWLPGCDSPRFVVSLG
jgi:hypothetical protein